MVSFGGRHCSAKHLLIGLGKAEEHRPRRADGAKQDYNIHGFGSQKFFWL